MKKYRYIGPLQALAIAVIILSYTEFISNQGGFSDKDVEWKSKAEDCFLAYLKNKMRLYTHSQVV